MTYREPWSKEHKQVSGGARFSLSNSFAQPLTSKELVELALARGDEATVELFHEHSLEYTPMGGSLDLRSQIAELYGPHIQADHIVVCVGAQVALQIAARAILDESSHSIVFSPGYQSLQDAPHHEGGQATTIPLRPESGWQINLAAVEAAIRPATKYLVINEPYNPAGTLMSAALQAQLVDLATRYDLYILSDEVYRLLEHDPDDRLPALADVYAKGLSVCTLSKPWGGCGITIGWVALQDLGLRQKLIDVQYFGTACPSRASEIQALMVLRASDQVLSRNLRIIHRNLALLDEFFEAHPDLFEWVRPKAGAIAFVRFKGPLTSRELGAQLALAGISIKPAYVFTQDLQRYGDYFRIGYGEESMPAALEALTQFVEDNEESWRSLRPQDTCSRPLGGR
jgi:aspartate/methionine/tyrosine aminotransferase